jgi:tetratricopeptide (TPR) repeat protein
VRDANPGTPESLAELIAQRTSTIIRAAERARDCDEQRRLGRFARALEAARKALETEPNLPAAHLCIATIHEAQRLPADSVVTAARRALAGDSLNTHALETIARQYQIKGDTASALQWFERLVRADPSNKGILLGLVTQLQLRKEYARAERLLRDGMAQFPGDQQLHDRLYQVCIEGGLWGCVLEALNARVANDTSLLADTATLKIAIGAAQQKPDTASLCRYTQAAVRHYPREISFLKTRGTCFEWLRQPDSAIAVYIRAYRGDTTDVSTALLVSKTIIESATYDTTGGGRDTTLLPPRRAVLAERLEMARPFLNRGLASRDTAIQLNTAVMILTAGSKLAQAAAYERAYPWLEQLLALVPQRSPADTIGPRHQIRMNASFWYTVASTITLRTVLQEVIDKKSCALAAQVAERMRKTRETAQVGRRVHEPTMRQMLGILDRYETPMRQVKQAYKCTNF